MTSSVWSRNIKISQYSLFSRVSYLLDLVNEIIDENVPTPVLLASVAADPLPEPQSTFLTPYIISALFFTFILIMIMIWGVLRMLDL